MIFRTKDSIIDMLTKQIELLNKELREQRMRNDILVDRLLVQDKVQEVVPQTKINTIEEIIDDRDGNDIEKAFASMSVVGQEFGEDDKLNKEVPA